MRDRRRREKRRGYVALSLLGIVIVGGLVWTLRQPFLRINTVTVVAGDPSLAAYATAALQGAYFGVIPRDSTFFVPAHAIRARILAEHADIAAVSVYHTGIRSLAIRADARTAVARWCGLAPAAGATPYCYVFDPNGFLYAAEPDPEGGATSTPPLPTLNTFALYAPLAGSTSEPLRATIAQADRLPDAFDFARRLMNFGSAVTMVVMHDGEVDDYLASGTEVLYLLGQEDAAYTALNSAKADFNLADGSAAYVDARFPGKLYVKPKG